MTLIVLGVACASFSLLQSLVAPVLSLLQVELRTSQNTVTWVLTAYLLSASVCTPIVGRAGDLVGKGRILVWTLFALALGSVLAAISTSISLMIVGRVIQGVGGGVVPLSYGIIRDEFPDDKIGNAVGLIAASLALGLGTGLVIAGPIVAVLDFHWLFWLPVVITLTSAIATRALISPTRRGRNRGGASASAAALLAAWLVALLLGISQSPTLGWSSPVVIGLLALAMVLALCWIYVESTVSHPLIDLRMMRLPSVWTSNVVTFLFGFGGYSVFAFVPEFLQTPKSSGYGLGASVTASGLLFLPLTVGMFVAGVLSGRVSARYGMKRVMICGSLACTISFAIMASAPGTVLILVAMLILGVGSGPVYASVAAIVVDAVPAHQTGVASGMNANIRTIGGAIGGAIVATIITSRIAADGLPSKSGYQFGFALLAAVTLLALVMTILMPTPRTLEADTRVGVGAEQLPTTGPGDRIVAIED